MRTFGTGHFVDRDDLECPLCTQTRPSFGERFAEAVAETAVGRKYFVRSVMPPTCHGASAETVAAIRNN
jgi:hypothetical protein